MGARAEKYFSEDPNTCLLKIRQFAELLARTIAANVGMYKDPTETQLELINKLERAGNLSQESVRLFHDIRRIGNTANHNFVGTPGDALTALKMAWALGVWFHRFSKEPTFKSGPFVPPQAPPDPSADLAKELARLQGELESSFQRTQTVQESLEKANYLLNQTEEEKRVWEKLAQEAEQSKAEINARLEALQAEALQAPAATADKAAQMAQTIAPFELDEAATRTIIDQQLRDAGWETDTQTLRHGLGVRPQKGRNMAIAEWPTESGPADYVLFVGLTPVAAVEAKKENSDVSAYLLQAKRYSRGFKFTDALIRPEGHPWGNNGEFKIPFGFSTNGRPYLRQVETLSGIWFVDMRRPTNHGRALPGWYSPEGLFELLKQDHAAAETKLEEEGFDYDLKLRDYQKTAIQRVEEALAAGDRFCLLAMATGTGKTKTAMALMYRLLKTQRFRRILFVVDRYALGDQAARDFESTRMENLQTFTDIFALKELEDRIPDKDTSVHIATIQGLIRRVLQSDMPPTVDQYDCIIVDECHRGYLLDRDLSDTEFIFRDQADYQSNYRRVLEYFDAVKIGLTATPALQTTEIFGEPVFQYTYREAVIDEVLIDHEPPTNIVTRLSADGIRWAAGDNVGILDRANNKIDYFRTPDEITMEVDKFNTEVITEPFNRVVCKELAKEIDVPSKEKTLIFCATNEHADTVVKVLKEELKERHGEVDDDSVVKITSKADKPMDLIRRYKNEQLPQIAVTVDLLTTGIDVPAITNLVFIRRVNSRILYEQMLGRATRRCDEIGKEVFRIYDAVGIYDALQDVIDMKPVVVNPKITFSELGKELLTVNNQDHVALARDQFIAKLLRKRRHLTETQTANFEAVAGQTPDEFIRDLRRLSGEEITDWFLQRAKITEILDEKIARRAKTQLVSDHADELLSIQRGYGRGQRPEDYLEEFRRFIQESGNDLPAMQAVLQRPRDLTRKDLKELMLALSLRGFDETSLESAWRDSTNQEMAARIIGYVRQAALGDPLRPWAERVDNALRKILSSRNWTNPQRQWLEKIASQTKATLVVDREAMDAPDQFFKREAGGFNSLNKKFDGQLEEILHNFNELIWNPDVA